MATTYEQNEEEYDGPPEQSALYPYNGADTASLSFHKGDIIEVLTQLGSGWWDGVIWRERERGWFPSNYVRRITDEEAEFARAQLEEAEARDMGLDPDDRIYGGAGSVNLSRLSTGSELWDGRGALPGGGGGGNGQQDGGNQGGYGNGGDRFAETSRRTMMLDDSNGGAGGGGGAEGAWIDWVPRVTDDGRIYYFNPRTGEEAAEMPSAEDDPELDLDRTQTQAPPGRPARLMDEEDDEDPLAFFDEHGFGTEELLRNGISPITPQAVSRDDAGSTLYGSSSSQRTASNRTGRGTDSGHTRAPSGASTLHLLPQTPFPENRRNEPPRAVHTSNGPPGSSSSHTDSHTSHSSRTQMSGPGSYLRMEPDHVDPRRFSGYTDDSRVDTEYSGSGTYGVQSKNRELSSMRQELQGLLDPPPTRSFDELEVRVMDALRAVVACAGPAALSRGTDDSASRDALARCTKNLIDEVRDLFQVTGQLDHDGLGRQNDPRERRPSRSSFASLGSSISITPPHPHHPELTVATRRINAEFGLVLAQLRGIWSLLAPSLTDGVSESPEAEETDAQIERRGQLLRERRDRELQLRSECLRSTEELGARLGDFFRKWSEIMQIIMPEIPKANFKMPRHVHGNFTMRVDAILLPGGGSGGNWRGSGFAKISEGAIGTGSGLPALKKVVPPRKIPARNISAEVVSDVGERGAVVQEQTARVQHLLRALFGRSQSVVTATMDEQRSSSPDPPPAAMERYPEIVGALFPLLRLLGNLVDTVEDINIASRVDLDVDDAAAGLLSLVRAVGVSTSPELGVPEDPTASQAAEYKTTLHSARQLIAALGVAKQGLYDASGDLILITQDIAASEMDVDDTINSPTNAPAQPPGLSPMSYRRSVQPAANPVRTLVNVTESINEHVEAVGTCLSQLAIIADSQAKMPTQMRRQSIAVRESLIASMTQPYRQSVGSTTTQSSRSGSVSPASSRLRRSRGLDEEDRESGRGSFDDHRGGFTSSTNTLATTAASDRRESVSSRHLRRDSLASASSRVPESVPMPGRSKSEVPGLTLLTNVERDPTGAAASARSPTRTKKLAKFFGDEAAAEQQASLRAPVPTASPSFLEPDYSGDDISFNLDNQVRGGTLKALVVKLTAHEGPDVAFLRVFLMTYRTFASSHSFLDLLIERYHLQPPDGLSKVDLQTWIDRKQKVVRIRVINVMRSWIESYLSDADEMTVLQRVASFAANDMTDSNLVRQVVQTCDRRRSNGGPKRIMPMTAPGNPPPSVVPRNIRKLKFLDIDPLELARQLTLFDSKLFTQIEVNECLGKAWPKEFASEGTPHIKAMIDMSNSITRWVAETILSQSELKKRANTIKHFISIAERCRMLNNFSTLMQIIAGLNSTPIHRLRRTWESVTQKYTFSLNQLNNIMSPTKNYAAYREMIRNMTPPCVPFLGVYLTDWTFIGDGNPDNLREKPNQINFNKRQKAAELIVQIQSYQSMPYQLTLVPAISNFISDHLDTQPDEQILFNMSLEIEPRERDDEKVARLLAESGFL